MRFTLVPILLFVATICHGADDATTASRTLDGMKAQFPARSIADGVTVLTGALKSCHSSSESSDPVADLKKARQGDHVRFVFAKPVTLEVLGEKFEASEVVFSAGVFWLRCGNKVQRCTKYEHEKMKLFEVWYRQLLPAT
jgi:hypothetical protein